MLIRPHKLWNWCNPFAAEKILGKNKYNTEMGYDIVVYLGSFYSVYALIYLLFGISDFDVHSRIRKNKDNTPLKLYTF